MYRRRQKVLWRIHRTYETRTQQVDLGALRLNFTRIANPDRVLDQVADAEDRRERRVGRRTASDELHLPYWAELWDSAYGIAQFLCSGKEDSRLGVRCSVGGSIFSGVSPPLVLDLGCGMGLAGAVAAALGGRVTFADLEKAPLLFARLNSLPWRRRIRTRRLDWRKDRLGQRFQLILGADILYERAQWDFLDAFWRAHLARGGTILLGEPGRQTGEAFVPWIRARGWTVREFQETVATRVTPIRLLELSLSGAPEKEKAQSEDRAQEYGQSTRDV